MTASDLEPTEIFVSHISEEKMMAAAIKALLQEVFSKDIRLFTSSDITSIIGGESWLDAVKKSLKKASAVIVLCSRASVQRSWVQFETGAAWYKEIPIIPVCHSGLRLTELPIPLSLKQGCEINEIGLEQLCSAVGRALNTGRDISQATIAAHLQKLLAVEKKFKAAQMVHFERCIEIVIPPPGIIEGLRIPENSVVEANDDSLKLFGYFSGPRTWSEIEISARRSADQRWLKELQATIAKASRNESFRPVQAIFHNDVGSFQPQLSRRETLADSSSRFHVNFVETLSARVTEIQDDFVLMGTLIKLGMRFRYEVLNKFTRPARTAAQARQGSAQAVTDELIERLRDAIEVIENDAVSRGSENINRSSVAELFASEVAQQDMDKVQDDWEEARKMLFDRMPTPREIVEALEKMRLVNYRFMTLLVSRFNELIEEKWRPIERPPQNPPSKL